MVNIENAYDIIDNLKYSRSTIVIDTLKANDFVLAKDYQAQINVPPFNRSAMDGYAVNCNEDLSAKLKVINTVYAGDTSEVDVGRNECVKIMTGGQVPTNLERVIVQELATENDGYVTFNETHRTMNANISLIGEDIAKGDKIGSKHQLITPSLISSLISCGVFQVEVYVKPKILFVSTGDEIVSNEQKLKPGQIYNSNMAYIVSRLNQLGFKCDSKHIGDNIDNIRSIFNLGYNLIITTGAISVGDKDIFRKFINTNQCTVHFDRVNIMPGGPCCFWSFGDDNIISLAGSPFANIVTFELLARRVLAQLTHDHTLVAQQYQINLLSSYKKTIKKTRFVKAHINHHGVSIPGSNHMASSAHEMNLCNAFIELKRGEHDLNIGDLVTVIDIRRQYE